jgi:hypothetical protein
MADESFRAVCARAAAETAAELDAIGERIDAAARNRPVAAVVLPIDEWQRVYMLLIGRSPPIRSDVYMDTRTANAGYQNFIWWGRPIVCSRDLSPGGIAFLDASQLQALWEEGVFDHARA